MTWNSDSPNRDIYPETAPRGAFNDTRWRMGRVASTSISLIRFSCVLHASRHTPFGDSSHSSGFVLYVDVEHQGVIVGGDSGIGGMADAAKLD